MLNHHSSSQKQNNIFAASALRLAVAAYIAVLGYKIITNQDTTMSPVTAKIIGGAMFLAAALFCVYIGIRWRADKQAAAQDSEKDAEQ